MGFWRALADRIAPSSAPNKEFSESAPRPIDRILYEMRAGAAGHVGRTEALSVPAVLRGRNLICSVATLPLVQFDQENRVAPLPLLRQIDPDVPNVVTLAQTLEDLLFEGLSWWRITEFGADGYPTAATHLDVGTVSLEPPTGRNPAPLPGDHDPRGAVVWVDGKQVPAAQIIRFDSPNPGVLKSGAKAVRRALLLDAAAAMYADDPRPLDYFTPTEGADPAEDDEIQEILDEWKAARKTRSTGYVPAAMKYNTVDQPTPADLQLVELQKRAALDIANALGLDPEDLGISTTSRTYANATDRRRDRINDVLSPYMRAITDRLSMGDVTKRGYVVRFDLDDYMRADPMTRWNVYEKAKNMGAMTVEEIRVEEGMTSSPEVGSLAEVQPIRPGVAASGKPTVNFDASPHRFADVPVQNFAVDRESRTIRGRALPYGEVSKGHWRRYRFEPGALRWSEMSRVKLLRDHDYSQAIGKAIELTDAPGGFDVAFQVARGPEGDRALSLAEDGVLDGMSVGVDFDDADTIPDPNNKGVTLVRRATLHEISLTAMPSFDGARVTKVAASRQEGNPMTAPTEPTSPAPVPTEPTPVPQTFSINDLGAAIAAALHPATPQEPQGRQTVNPTRQTLTASVNEPAPYRFDRKGNLLPGAHEFSADIIAGLRDNDVAAYERAMEFVRQQFDVITTDVNELNPTRNRPDMYVDQRSFRYPVWEAISKGTLTDITPFTFPKFSSAGSLVGNHTEGTEPSSGTFVATNQTVTPTAVSGKAKISRETWDQGGNPQIGNLIWRQMQKAWYEALEAAAVAVLDAATPTAIALTAGGGTTGQTLDAEITAAFAALQFVRGGFSMTDMFTQIDLYKALVAAKDGDGRRLYPALGPSNASGSVRDRFGAIDINGVVALPAWALAATGSVVASSYLFDRESVHGWASAPQRLTIDNIEVANVYIGLWGYKATAISDIAGVREITYDPVA